MKLLSVDGEKWEILRILTNIFDYILLFRIKYVSL